MIYWICENSSGNKNLEETTMYIIETENIGLRKYTHDDDYEWYLCWQDIDTQKGYNGIFDETFDETRRHPLTKKGKNFNQDIRI